MYANVADWQFPALKCTYILPSCLAKLLEDVAGMMSMNTHLKFVLSFRGVFDLDFLFIVDI